MVYIFHPTVFITILTILAGNESTIPDATEQPEQNISSSETKSIMPATEKPKEANTSKPQPSTSSSGTNKPADNSKTPSSTTTKQESSQTPAKTDPPEEKPKSAFAKPFDVATMKRCNHRINRNHRHTDRSEMDGLLLCKNLKSERTFNT